MPSGSVLDSARSAAGPDAFLVGDLNRGYAAGAGGLTLDELAGVVRQYLDQEYQSLKTEDENDPQPTAGFQRVIQTSDGGYVAIGGSASNNGGVPGNNGDEDKWVVKFGPDPVGINERTDQASFNVFPNPFRDLLTIDSRGMDLPIEWSLVDQAGKIVSSGILQPLDQVSGEQLAPGSYTLMLDGDNERRSAVIIKE